MEDSAFIKLLTKNVPHIPEQIFFSLDYDTFITCAEVCTTWHMLIKSPRYQKKARSLFRREIREREEELWTASREGDVKKVRRIVQNELIDVNCSHYNNVTIVFGTLTALSIAAKNCRANVVKVLIEHGADIHTADDFGWTPLHSAAYSGHKKLVKLLLDKGSDPNRRTKDESTPLHIAARHGHKGIVQLLLIRGANANNRDVFNRTPLRLAETAAQWETVKLLERHIKRRKGRLIAKGACHAT